MTDQSVFSNDKEKQTPAITDPSQSAFSDQLGMIKNDEGAQKYDTVAKALDALAHSQAFIPQLKAEAEGKEAEIVELKKQLASRATVEDVVSRLTPDPEPEVGIPPQTVGLGKEDVLKMLETFTTDRATASQAQANEAQVSNMLRSKYGDKTSEVLSNKAQEMGMSVQDLQALAQKSPIVVQSMFQLSGESTTFTQSDYSPREEVRAPLEPPTKSLLRGASTKDQVEYFHKIRDEVYKKHDVKTV